MKHRGFTLVELLVVVSIIGLLSAVVITALSGGREKAKVTQMANSMQQIERALHLLRDDLGCWPKEQVIDAGTCQTLIAGGQEWTRIDQTAINDTTRLGKYLKQVPYIPFPGQHNPAIFRYGNRTNNSSVCPLDHTGTSHGVTLLIVPVLDGSLPVTHLYPVYEKLNELFDKDTDASTEEAQLCGKVRWTATGRILYRIADEPHS